MNICMYGASSTRLDEIYSRSVFAFGEKLALRNHSLIFGGGREGLMGSAALGVASKGGCLIGIAPRFFDKPGVLYEQCSEFIFTDTMRQRKSIMETRSDGFVMVPGGIGTFEEFFEILTLKQLDQLHKPLAVFNVKDYFSPLLTMLSNAVSQGFMAAQCLELFQVFTDIDEMLDYLEGQ